MSNDDDDDDDADDMLSRVGEAWSSRRVVSAEVVGSNPTRGALGALVELVNTLACHVRDRRFESGTPRQHTGP